MEEVREVDDELLAAVIALAGRRVVALTGAGISTESGIPDYRGPGTKARARTPMRFAQFAASEAWRRRYWARATVGWPRVRDAQPNAGHAALAALEGARLTGVITQNVDGLHSTAGSRRVVELHGALREVVCLACGAIARRDDVHARVLAANPAFATGARATFAPDGDVELADEIVEGFRLVDCGCGGPLKPRVVFFGENVEQETLAQAWRTFDEANALLVVGSSLEVFSGRRFVEEASRRRWPIVVVNVGPTRSDALATVRLDRPAGAALPALARALA